MKIHHLHSWQVDIAQAKQIQQKLATKVLHSSKDLNPCLIAGIDISISRATGIANAAVVVLNYPELEIIELKTAEGKISFPYVPGFLSFREAPLALAACQKLINTPDLVMVDGNGIAHPRRFGIASHLGIILNIPTIGCAKSRLCGTYESPPSEAGAYTELRDNGELIGAALRTKAGVNPVYISVGHKIDLATSISWIIKCCRGYRLPQPARLAHLAAGGKLPCSAAKNFFKLESTI